MTTAVGLTAETDCYLTAQDSCDCSGTDCCGTDCRDANYQSRPPPAREVHLGPVAGDPGGRPQAWAGVLRGQCVRAVSVSQRSVCAASIVGNGCSRSSQCRVVSAVQVVATVQAVIAVLACQLRRMILNLRGHTQTATSTLFPY